MSTGRTQRSEESVPYKSKMHFEYSMGRKIQEVLKTKVCMRYTTVTRDAQTRQLFASHRVV